MPGDHLLALGFPLDSDLSVSAGVLSNEFAEGGLWQIAIPLNYGNSGGPVVDERGVVIGMVRGGVSQAEEINFMRPINLLTPILNAAGLIYPAYPTGGKSAPPLAAPMLKPAQQTKDAKCHEIVDIAAGLPPVYTKRIVCD
jgi:S1-C subfamily serine protease